jgi:hypothetical protein
MTLAERKEKYLALMHAVQSGVAAKMDYDYGDTSLKHLRVGVNSAMIETAALAKLMLDRGLFTEEEYLDALIDRAQAEVEMYERELSKHYGRPVKIA